jgi:hypothetical protein
VKSSAYVVAVVIMMALGVSGATLIALFRHEPDNTMMIMHLFGFLTPTTVALLALMKSQETHLSVNSRMDELLKVSIGRAREQGRQDERDTRR